MGDPAGCDSFCNFAAEALPVDGFWWEGRFSKKRVHRERRVDDVIRWFDGTSQSRVRRSNGTWLGTLHAGEPSATASPFGLFEQHFSQANFGRRDFDQFVVLDVFQGRFERQVAWWFEDDIFIATAGPHVGQLLFTARIDRHVVIACVFANDHPFVNLFAGADKEVAAIL